MPVKVRFFFFFFNDTATTEIYTLSLHDALPICGARRGTSAANSAATPSGHPRRLLRRRRSEEHTSELQSPCNLVCRLLLEKKKKLPQTSFPYLYTYCQAFTANTHGSFRHPFPLP